MVVGRFVLERAARVAVAAFKPVIELFQTGC